MKVLIKKTTNGSPDGITIKEYIEDEIYELPEKLAINFVRDQKIAVLAPQDKLIPPIVQAEREAPNLKVPERAKAKVFEKIETLPETPLRKELKKASKKSILKRLNNKK